MNMAGLLSFGIIVCYFVAVSVLFANGTPVGHHDGHHGLQDDLEAISKHGLSLIHRKGRDTLALHGSSHGHHGLASELQQVSADVDELSLVGTGSHHKGKRDVELLQEERHKKHHKKHHDEPYGDDDDDKPYDHDKHHYHKKPYHKYDHKYDN